MLCRPYLNSNFNYLNVNPPTSYERFFQHVATALGVISTPYVLLADNDDLLLKKGIQAAIKELKGDSSIVASGGPILGYQGQGTPTKFASIPYRAWFPRSGQGLREVRFSRIDVQSTWYSVFRREFLLEAFTYVIGAGVRDPYLFEYCLTDYMYLQGKFGRSSRPHYARLANQKDRSIMLFQQAEPIEFGERLWLQKSHEVDAKLAVKYGLELNSLETNARRLLLVYGIASTSESFRTQLAVYLRLAVSSLVVCPFWMVRLLARLGIYI